MLVATAVLWNFSVTLPQPLFPIFYVESLGGSEGMWGVVSAASLVTTILGQRYWGPLADRHGNRNLMVASGIFAALIPLFWFLALRPGPRIVNAYAGFIWAGYNLAAFNLVLEATPDARRTTYVAGYNGLVGLAQFAGPIAGGLLADAVSIEAVLLVAAGLRLAGWLLLPSGDPGLGGRSVPLEELPRGSRCQGPPPEALSSRPRPGHGQLRRERSRSVAAVLPEFGGGRSRPGCN